MTPRRPPEDRGPENLRRFVAGETSPDLIEWVRAALQKHVDSGSPGDGRSTRSVEAALGIDRAGRRRAADRALLDAAAILRESAGGSPWQLAKLLAGAIGYVETRVLPILAAGVARELSPLDKAIRRAVESGAPFPRTARNLYDFLSLQVGAGSLMQKSSSISEPSTRLAA